jgi:CubicO group peptidase (beta-lactamase class C family)
VERRGFLIGSSAAIAAGLTEWSDSTASALAALAPLHDLVTKQVADKKIPGAVWLVARGDDVVVDAVGVTAVDGAKPMRRDTIFRIASMTKAVTATAVMMLVEEGKLALDAPAQRWLPELANRKVLRRIDAPLDDVEPAQRAITVQDLLRFTLGFGLLFDNSPPIMKKLDELQLVNGPPVPMTPHAPDEWMRRFGTLPLMHQPGARWMYNTGSLLQGVLVRRAAGQDFDVFVEERILRPLGMHDTGFYVPKDKLDRFAGCGIVTDPQSGKATRMDADGAQSAYASKPVFPSGAGGLVSTVDDYLAFARMLLNGGTHGKQRLLRAESVHAMSTNQLTPQQIAKSDFFPHFFDTHGWGYGMAVTTAPDAVSKSPGRYGWDGGFGTSWINDPSRNLISIVMTQSADFLFGGALDAYWRALYAATGKDTA